MCKVTAHAVAVFCKLNNWLDAENDRSIVQNVIIVQINTEMTLSVH